MYFEKVVDLISMVTKATTLLGAKLHKSKTKASSNGMKDCVIKVFLGFFTADTTQNRLFLPLLQIEFFLIVGLNSAVRLSLINITMVFM